MVADRLEKVLEWVRVLAQVVTPGGNQLEHALRTAESLRRRRGDAILVVAGLVHDIGKAVDLARHEQVGAAWLHGHVHPDVVWLVRWHVVAQRMSQVPEPLGSRLRSHPRFQDLLALVAAEIQPDLAQPLPPLEAFHDDIRSVLIGV